MTLELIATGADELFGNDNNITRSKEPHLFNAASQLHDVPPTFGIRRIRRQGNNYLFSISLLNDNAYFIQRDLLHDKMVVVIMAIINPKIMAIINLKIIIIIHPKIMAIIHPIIMVIIHPIIMAIIHPIIMDHRQIIMDQTTTEIIITVTMAIIITVTMAIIITVTMAIKPKLTMEQRRKRMIIIQIKRRMNLRMRLIIKINQPL